VEARHARISFFCGKPWGRSARDPIAVIGTRRHPLKWGKETEVVVQVDIPASALPVRVYTPDDLDLETVVANIFLTLGPGQRRRLTYRRYSGWLSFLRPADTAVLELTGK
jgi:hypothetical protein